MVVTEMKTPIRALARASVNETTPTIPARTATTIEKVRDADVGAEGLDEVAGAVRQADQAYMKGHCRSTPGRPL
jgi:hypothetical protein